MSNSFQRHGINHLSPSALNLWRAQPGIWGLRYIGKIKNEPAPAMHRGTAVETGLVALLHKVPLPGAIEAALQNFDLNLKEETEESKAERNLIAPMVEQASKWKPPSELAATQLKIEHYFDHIPIPIIGYIDLSLIDSIDVDCKSTKAMPSAPRPDHIRQVSLYRAARGRKGGLLYLTPKRQEYYAVNDAMMEEGLNELHAASLSLYNFLSRCESREDVLRSLPIDWDAYQAPKTKVPLADILSAG